MFIDKYSYLYRASNVPKPIPVIITSKTYPTKHWGRHRVRPRALINIKLEQSTNLSCTMPTVMTTNLRSLIPQIFNLTEEISARGILISLLSEVWFDPTNSLHNAALEKSAWNMYH